MDTGRGKDLGPYKPGISYYVIVRVGGGHHREVTMNKERTVFTGEKFKSDY